MPSPLPSRPDELLIRPLLDPACLSALAADAADDGRAMVARLVQEWNDGVNRFDQRGERAYVATIGDRVCGVCGLNQDPFAHHPTVGRVRRLYVAVVDRRRGVGAALLSRLAIDARRAFDWLHLRTRDPIACAFYESMGLERVADDTNCTHRRRASTEAVG